MLLSTNMGPSLKSSPPGACTTKDPVPVQDADVFTSPFHTNDWFSETAPDPRAMLSKNAVLFVPATNEWSFAELYVPTARESIVAVDMLPTTALALKE